jgi:hypothetical protein
VLQSRRHAIGHRLGIRRACLDSRFGGMTARLDPPRQPQLTAGQPDNAALPCADHTRGDHHAARSARGTSSIASRSRASPLQRCRSPHPRALIPRRRSSARKPTRLRASGTTPRNIEILRPTSTDRVSDAPRMGAARQERRRPHPRLRLGGTLSYCSPMPSSAASRSERPQGTSPARRTRVRSWCWRRPASRLDRPFGAAPLEATAALRPPMTELDEEDAGS